MSVGDAAYARQLKQLLPPGALWLFETSSMLTRLLLGLAAELARVDSRAETLTNEWDPRTAVETLPDWERVLDLPDEFSPATGLTSERQVAAARKMAARGGQTAAYFIALAAALGFSATVQEVSAHVWRLVVDLSTSTASATSTVARAGSARAGDRLANRSVTELEGVINRAKPAHSICWFQYLGA